MKKLLSLFVLSTTLLYHFSAWCLESNIRFDQRLYKNFDLDCVGNEWQCERLCQDQAQCSFDESPTPSSLGVSLKVSHFFQNINRYYMKGAKVVDFHQLQALLKSGNYLSLDAKSLHNQEYKYNAKTLQRMFAVLCEEQHQPLDYSPVVIFDQNFLSRVGESRYLICADEIYEMQYIQSGTWGTTNF